MMDGDNGMGGMPADDAAQSDTGMGGDMGGQQGGQDDTAMPADMPAAGGDMGGAQGGDDAAGSSDMGAQQ